MNLIFKRVLIEHPDASEKVQKKIVQVLDFNALPGALNLMFFQLFSVDLTIKQQPNNKTLQLFKDLLKKVFVVREDT